MDCIKMVLCDGQEVASSTVDGWCLCQRSGACAMKWAGHSMPGQRNHTTGGRWNCVVSCSGEDTRLVSGWCRLKLLSFRSVCAILWLCLKLVYRYIVIFDDIVWWFRESWVQYERFGVGISTISGFYGCRRRRRRRGILNQLFFMDEVGRGRWVATTWTYSVFHSSIDSV